MGGTTCSHPTPRVACGTAAVVAAAAQAAGLDVVQCITVVDREEGARERIEGAGHPFVALVTRSDLEAS